MLFDKNFFYTQTNYAKIFRYLLTAKKIQHMTTTKDKILTIEDVAKLKRVSPECIRIAIRKGKLKATYFHVKWHIRESNYRKYEKNCQSKLLPQKLISLGQASEILKISQIIILRAIQNGVLKTYESDQRFKVHLDSLLEWYRKSLQEIDN